MASIFKQGNEIIAFPGVDGVPFRGTSIPVLKGDEFDKLVEVLDVKIRIFKLNNDEDLKEYARVVDMIAKGVFTAIDETKNWVPEDKTWYVLLRWAEKYKELPNHSISRIQPRESGGFERVY